MTMSFFLVQILELFYIEKSPNPISYSARKRFNVKEALIYLVSKFSTDEGEFYFEQDLLQKEQWEIIFNESLYNEEICIFRQDQQEFMLVIKKPCIEINNISKGYVAQFYPISSIHGEEIEPGDVTYQHMIKWIYDDCVDWEDK